MQREKCVLRGDLNLNNPKFNTDKILPIKGKFYFKL